MKRLISLFVILFLFAKVNFAQEYPLVSIHDIQFWENPTMTEDFSQYLGDTVRFRGIVMVRPVIDPETDRRPIIWRGARWSTFAQDPENNEWAGIVVLQNDTTGENQNTFFDLVDTAQVVEFTAVIENYFTTTQSSLLLNPITPVQIIETLPKRPDPITLPITDFMENGNLKPESEKYEGMFVRFENVITSDRNPSNGTFVINDANGNKINILDQSGYFTTRTHKLREYQPPIDGTTLGYIQGFLESRNNGYYLIPVYPNDISISFTPPSISSIRRNLATISPNQDIEISAKIVDPDGSVQEAKLYYKIDNESTNIIAMTRDVDTTMYKATIPGINKDSALVSFYIRATDNMNLSSINPTDTVNGKYFFYVLNRPLTIQDVQYNPYGRNLGGYNNYKVTVSGIVTTDTIGMSTRLGNGALKIYMQNGEGPWSGIWLNAINPTGVNVYELRKGDNVTISGTVVENFDVTRLDTITQIIVNSQGNPLPQPKELTTGEIDKLTTGSKAAEQWESVLIKYKNITVTNDNADGPPSNFGEIFVDDGSGETRVELQDGAHFYHNLWDQTLLDKPGNIQVLPNTHFDELVGVLYFSFSNYKLIPRTNEDFVGYTDVEDEQNSQQPKQYALNQNYPNPFNPSTTISYSIPNDGFVSLRIYNVLGQEIKSLVNQFQKSGNYKLMFDASNLPSGVYFYKIEANNFTQVKKMMLLK